MKYVLAFFMCLVFFIFAFSDIGNVPDVARLHVVANSDSSQDIDIKMKVSEALCELLKEEKFDSTKEIGDELKKRLPEIEKIANEILVRTSAGYGMSAEVGVRHFDKKSLGNSSFPEGDYLALTVILGEGGGHNWWSVIFPDLSFKASLASGEEGGKGKTVVIGGDTVVKLRCFLRELLTKGEKKSTITHV